MALEIVDTTRRDDWVHGKIYPAKRACVQGSDSHSIATIGTRPIWLRVAYLNLDGIRQAFKDPLSRIRFPDEYDDTLSHSYIESLHITGGFFGGTRCFFQPWLELYYRWARSRKVGFARIHPFCT